MTVLETIDERAKIIFEKEKQRLTELNLSQQELVEWAAAFSTQQILLQAALNTFMAEKINTSLQQSGSLENQLLLERAIEHLREEIIQAASDVNSLHAHNRSTIARNAANHRHKNSQEKKELLLEIWASGKYKHKSTCAEAEHEKLSMGYEAARDALKGAPNPIRGGC